MPMLSVITLVDLLTASAVQDTLEMEHHAPVNLVQVIQNYIMNSETEAPPYIHTTVLHSTLSLHNSLSAIIRAAFSPSRY